MTDAKQTYSLEALAVTLGPPVADLLATAGEVARP